MPAQFANQNTDAENSRKSPQPSGVGGREATVSTSKLPTVQSSLTRAVQPTPVGTPSVTASVPGKFGNKGQ